MKKFDKIEHTCPIVGHIVNIRPDPLGNAVCPYCFVIYADDQIYASMRTQRVMARRLKTYKLN